MKLQIMTVQTVIDATLLGWRRARKQGGEALEKVAQRSCECPSSGCVQGQFGWGTGHPDLAGGSPAHETELKLDDFQVPSNASCMIL